MSEKEVINLVNEATSYTMKALETAFKNNPDFKKMPRQSKSICRASVAALSENILMELE